MEVLKQALRRMAHPTLESPKEQREVLEAAITRMADPLASGSMMTDVGVETLRRMHAGLRRPGERRFPKGAAASCG